MVEVKVVVTLGRRTWILIEGVGGILGFWKWSIS